MFNFSEDNPNYLDSEASDFFSNASPPADDVANANASAGGNLALMRVICDVWMTLPIALAGIIGNLVSIFVLRQYKPAMTTTMILQCLAWADTAYLTASVLLRSLRHVGIPNYDRHTSFIFFWLYPTTYAIRLIDTWLIVLLTVDRFIAVCYPLHASRLCSRAKTSVLILVIVLCSFAFSVPRYFEYIILDPSDKLRGSTNIIILNRDLMTNQLYTFIYRLSLFFNAMYLVPMTTVTILNTQLIVTFRRLVKNRATSLCINSFTSSSSHSSSSNRSVSTKASCSSSCSSSSTCSMTRTVTAVSVTVVLISIATDTVSMLSHGVWSVEQVFPHLVNLSHYRPYLANFGNVAVTLRCALNFVVYCAISRQFRVVLFRSFACHRSSPGGGVGCRQQATSTAGRQSSKISTSILSLLTGQRPRASPVSSRAASNNVMVAEENGCLETNPLNQALILRFVQR